MPGPGVMQGLQHPVASSVKGLLGGGMQVDATMRPRQHGFVHCVIPCVVFKLRISTITDRTDICIYTPLTHIFESVNVIGA